MLAYLRLMVREARRGNHKGWLIYDWIFQQNAAANPSLSWANLDPSLHSSFCIGTEPPPLVCTLCNELDHRSEECALSKTPAAIATHTSAPIYKDPATTSRSGRTPTPKCPLRKLCLSWNSGQCMLPGTHANTCMNVTPVTKTTRPGTVSSLQQTQSSNGQNGLEWLAPSLNGCSVLLDTSPFTNYRYCHCFVDLIL